MGQADVYELLLRQPKGKWLSASQITDLLGTIHRSSVNENLKKLRSGNFVIMKLVREEFKSPHSYYYRARKNIKHL